MFEQQNKIKLSLKAKLLHIIFIICSINTLSAQINPVSDTIMATNLSEKAVLLNDSIPLSDSLGLNANLMANDSIPKADSLAAPRFQYAISSDSLDAPVVSSARDSMITDIVNQKVHLYGNAQVDYTSIQLKAAHIIYDWKTNVVSAEGMPDSTGRMANFPVFSDGSQEFEAKGMRYNFISKKGIIYDLTTQQQDILIHAKRSKFISHTPKDSTEKKKDIIFSEDAIFTTCTADTPHFGVHSKRQKIVANKLVVSGPLNLEIMGVPTPLWLPFGFFPVTEPRGTGLLFPEFVTTGEQGFGLRGLGWFFPLGEHFNLSVKGDYFPFTGSWGLSATSQYIKKYKYTGSFNVGFNNLRTENETDGSINSQQSYSVRWSHNQAAAAQPTMKFGGTINFSLNDYRSTVSKRADDVLNNSLSSNINFSKKWRDKPFTFTSSFTHRQNTANKTISVSFPVMNFQTRTLYPFKKKERLGERKWYEDVTLTYKAEAKNTFSGTDSTFFSQKTLDEAKYGMKQDISTGTSFNILKYFKFNPSASYKEVWYWKTLRKDFTESLEIDTIEADDGTISYDTLSYGTKNRDTIPGFESYRTLNLRASVNTRVYGTLLFKKGRLKGLRHVMTPSVSFVYSPDYTANNKWFRDIRDPDSPTDLEDNPYSIYEGGIYGAPPTSGKQMTLTYGFSNLIEAKFFSKKDSIDKKIKLMESINVGGSYNFAKDSLQWSTVNLSARTRLFKGLTNFAFNLTWDPYLNEVNEAGTFRKRVNKLYYKETGKLLQFTGASFSFNTGITISKLRTIFEGKEEEFVEDLRKPKKEAEKGGDFLSLFDNFNISHTFRAQWTKTLITNKDTLTVTTNDLSVRGNIKLTKNWYITIGRIGYSFKDKRLTYPDIGFKRDIHCWEAGFNWQPDAYTFSFYIRAKGSTFGFLKLPYQRFRDASTAKNAFQ